MPLRGKSGPAYASLSLPLWPLVLLCGLLLAGVTCRPEQNPGGRPRKFISYYGHKEVQEGESFIIYCFADRRTKISWTKDGLPLRYLSPWQSYYVWEYNADELRVSRLEVDAADVDFSGGYSCSRESPAKHFVRVTALWHPAVAQPACHVLVSRRHS
ncbi:uncharacterized protein LOC144127500 [Amblyomma americanum]|uniref:Ig-like domain-containing protein n=1 Tax=Amblyomma americanum TaxID=6943 RepID=A0AAQ4D2H5_AMBAM